jgi:hypothetical protein
MSDKRSRWADPWFTERIGMLLILGWFLVPVAIGVVLEILLTLARGLEDRLALIDGFCQALSQMQQGARL